MSDGSLGAFCSVAIYVAAYVAWGEVFRARIDPWMRACVGDLLGTPLVARQEGDEAFSIPLWRCAGPSAVERNGFLGFISAAWLMLGAFVPILGLASLCLFTSWIGASSREVLYLMSAPFLIAFLVQQTRRQGHLPETRGESSLSRSRRPNLVRLPREEDS